MAADDGPDHLNLRPDRRHLALRVGYRRAVHQPDLRLEPHRQADASAGSTGYLGFRQQPTPGSRGRPDNYQRYHQSLVAFYSVTERSTLFYEWYVLMFTNAADNRPTHFMDGGILYRPTPNTQLDLRAGFGLSGRPDDFFTGAGFSVRF